MTEHQALTVGLRKEWSGSAAYPLDGNVLLEARRASATAGTLRKHMTFIPPSSSTPSQAGIQASLQGQLDAAKSAAFELWEAAHRGQDRSFKSRMSTAAREWFESREREMTELKCVSRAALRLRQQAALAKLSAEDKAALGIMSETA
jgi:hypothetical protein